MAVNDYTTIIEKIYVGFLGRPADPIGLAYYANMLNAVNAPTTTAAFLSAAATNTSIAAIFDSFGNSNESIALYGGSTTSAMVNTIYNYVLGRNAEAGGLTYWTSQLSTGQIPGSKLAFLILQAAENDTFGDALTVASKVGVATAYTNSLDQPAEIAAFNGAAAAASARALLNGVYAGTTAAQIQAQVDANILALTGTTPTNPTNPGGTTTQTFTLTVGNDSFTGGTGNDTFNATNATYASTDTLDGGAGTDTLNYSTTAGGVLPFATVSNIEVINIQNSGPSLSVNTKTFTGATNFNSNLSTTAVDLTTLTKGQQVGVIGNLAVINGAVSATYDNSVTATTLNFTSGTLGTAGVTINGNGITTETITSTGAANAAGTVTFGGNALTDVTINATTNLTLSGISGFKGAVTTNTVTVTGAATNVNVGTLDNTIGSVNGSGLTTGGITATLGTNTGIKFIGGGGNDVITSNGIALASGASVDAGVGLDRLVLTGGVAGSASAALYANFEELKLNNVTQDVSLFTGSTINKLILDGGAVVQNASAAQAANIQIMSSGTYDIGVTGVNPVNLTVDDGLAANNVILLGAPTLTGITTLSIMAVDTTSITSLTGATSLTNVTLSGSAVIGVVSGAVNFAAGTVFDGSTATNTVGIDLQNATTAGTGITIKGGSGNDVLIGTQQADTITGGAGNDILTTGHASTNASLVITSIGTGVATGIHTLTGGTGNDSFVISHSTVANASAITDLNLGTNVLAGGVDSLWFSGSGVATVVSGIADQTAAGSLANAVNAVLVIASAANNVAQFTYAGDSYIVVNGAGTATYDAAQDALVKVTGVAGTLDASDIHFM